MEIILIIIVLFLIRLAHNTNKLINQNNEIMEMLDAKFEGNYGTLKAVKAVAKELKKPKK